MAELAYQSSIISAREHKFIHEEALACELYGIFLANKQHTERGVEQLKLAQDKYMKWGALKKAKNVEDLIETICKAASKG